MSQEFQKFLKRLELALKLDIPYAERLRGEDGTPASVLILFSPDDDPALLLTVRTDLVETHKGQIAFPGGVSDPEDAHPNVHESHIVAALRENEEEMGIPRQSVRIVGQLPKLLTVTRFLVTPVVGVLNTSREQVSVKPNPAEIAEYFWAPLSVLTQQGTYREEPIEWRGREFKTHVYQVGQYRVWGGDRSNSKEFARSLGPGRVIQFNDLTSKKIHSWHLS